MVKICVDYGHWGQDSGATYNGRREDLIAKLISDHLQNKLREKGIETFSSYGDLEKRVTMSKNGKADYFISIHLNATKGGSGNEVLISRYASQKSKGLASSVLSSITDNTGLHKRGVRVDKEYLDKDLYVLKNTSMPAILVECGFIEKDWEIADIEGQAIKYASGITEGLCKYLGIDDKCSLCGK